MRSLLWFALMLFASVTSVFSEDIDDHKLARPEREQLAKCMSDTLIVIEKYHLGGSLFKFYDLFDAACGIEIDRTKSAVESQVKDAFLKKMLPGQVILGMVEKAQELYEKKPLSFCSSTGCSLEEYRTCLMRQMSAALKLRKAPIDFENQARLQCEDAESAARSALSNDFDNVLKRHYARGLNHKMNDMIANLIAGVRHAVVVLYAEDLVQVQPGRTSCKPQMCGASPCISLDANKPTEYECAINQK